MKTQYSHFYLYAKRWYKQSGSLVEDLRRIASNYSGTDIEYVRKVDAITLLIEATQDALKLYGNPDYEVNNLLHRIAGSAFSPETAVIEGCLSILCQAKTGGLLDEPDYSILPRRE
jgi:hypothetical protein